MRYYIIAGEASGDMHGGNLIREIRKLDVQSIVRCWGGEYMSSAGGEVVKHYKDLAFMGFIEVVKHLGTILRNIAFCKKDILNFKPDVLVLIDYPGFNMRIAQWAKQQGIKTVYYISPQIWAWKENRVHALQRDIDKMLVILPFEVDFYKRWNFPVTYTGHPLVEVIGLEKSIPPKQKFSEKPIIALLPGSRKQEIQLKLPIMLSVQKYFPDYQFIIAGAPSIPESIYTPLIPSDTHVSIVYGQTYDLLKQAKAALVTSGTATLETALFSVPQVVCYKGNVLSYWLAKKLIKVKYISLVNLIMDKPVVTELIQHDLNEKRLKEELEKLLNHPQRDQILADYHKLWHLLGDTPASQTAAKAIFDTALGK